MHALLLSPLLLSPVVFIYCIYQIINSLHSISTNLNV